MVRFNTFHLSLQTQTVDWLAEPASKLRVPNLGTFGWKFQNKLTCQTMAPFADNRNVALASSATVMITLIEESPSYGQDCGTDENKIVWNQLTKRAPVLKRQLAFDWLTARDASSQARKKKREKKSTRAYLGSIKRNVWRNDCCEIFPAAQWAFIATLETWKCTEPITCFLIERPYNHYASYAATVGKLEGEGGRLRQKILTLFFFPAIPMRWQFLSFFLFFIFYFQVYVDVFIQFIHLLD